MTFTPMDNIAAAHTNSMSFNTFLPTTTAAPMNLDSTTPPATTTSETATPPAPIATTTTSAATTIAATLAP